MSANQQVTQKLNPISWKDVEILEGLWKEKQLTNAETTIPSQYERIKERGNLDVLQLKWGGKVDKDHPFWEEPEGEMHPFWDSDIGKWIEAASYSLAKYPDPDIEAKVDQIIDYLGEAQQEDGYLNTYFQIVHPEDKWTNLYYMHELYCAGHLTEGAVAYYLATGKRKFLDIMCRYMDHIYDVFGDEGDKIRGYDGHQEIELALVKLYRVTGEKKYLELALFFIDERGRQPYFFEEESLKRGVDLEKTANQNRHLKYYLRAHGPFAEYQAHKPVREQDTPVGHSVRAMYMYCAMADLAAETGDETLLQACEVLWDRLTSRQLYITGGIGPSAEGERFTFDYDLPNEFTYNETCASCGLVFWSHRMLQFDGDSQYADIMEQALYNTVLGGVSHDGDKYFYANYLTVYPDRFKYASTAITDKSYPVRQPWFNVACCPPNVARLIGSIGQYMYSVNDEAIYVHLYSNNETNTKLGDSNVRIKQETNYPWQGTVRLTISVDKPSEFQVALRHPYWSPNAQVKLNGTIVEAHKHKGYLFINREWNNGDVIELTLDMPVMRVESHPSVRANAGRVALQRGPLVYCFEEVDNNKDLNDLTISADASITEQFEPDLLGGVVTLETTGFRRDLSGWDDHLYRPSKSEKVRAKLKAVPYYARLNRGFGEMLVWIKDE